MFTVVAILPFSPFRYIKYVYKENHHVLFFRAARGIFLEVGLMKDKQSTGKKVKKGLKGSELKMIRSTSYPNHTIYTQYTEEGNVYRIVTVLG